MLNALGGTRFCDSAVHGPLFFLQAPLDRFEWVTLTGLSWLPSRLTCRTLQFHHAPSTHSSTADGLKWVNVI